MRIQLGALAITSALLVTACGRTDTGSASAPGGTVQSLAQAGQQSYLVGFVRGRGIDRAAVARAGGRIDREWPAIEAVAAHLPAAAAAALAKNPNVEYVEQDAPRYALGKPSGVSDQGKPGGGSGGTYTDPNYQPSGEYTWGLVAVNAKQVTDSGVNGSGVAVCVADTGIDANHKEFVGAKLAGFQNFTGDGKSNDPKQQNDLSHHGTHVSGTIFAQLNNTGTNPPNGAGVVGVAPGVSLYMARVLGDDGSGSTSSVVSGIDWCRQKLTSQGGTEQHVVISMSLGSSTSSFTEQRAVDNAYNAGALVVAASGNDGGRIGYPAAYSSVIAVGAIDNHDKLASFSNYGKDQELVAPGVSVLSTVPTGVGQAASASANGTPFSSVYAAEGSGQGTVSNQAIVRTNTANNELCGTGMKDATLGGKIALVARGTCSFAEKAQNAVNSGALAMIVYNNTSGDLLMTLDTYTSPIPVVGIPQADGVNVAANSTGSVSVASSDYEYYDGTSMATPHVSAAAALVWSKKTNLSNVQLRSLLQSTAKDLGSAGRDSSFGYGLVDPLKALAN